jgi:hypothetical protein
MGYSLRSVPCMTLMHAITSARLLSPELSANRDRFLLLLFMQGMLSSRRPMQTPCIMAFQMSNILYDDVGSLLLLPHPLLFPTDALMLFIIIFLLHSV